MTDKEFLKRWAKLKKAVFNNTNGQSMNVFRANSLIESWSNKRK